MTLTDLLEDHHVPYKEHGEHHHVTQGWLGIDCPFCSADAHKFKLGLHPNSRMAHCWSCGKHHISEVFQELFGCSESEARRFASQTRLFLDTIEVSKRESKDVTVTLPQPHTALRAPHRMYLKYRGFDPDVIELRYGIRALSLHDRLAWRILVPIMDRNHRLVSWTTRSIADDVRNKYITASNEQSAIPIHSLLYGIHLCDRSTIIIHEGPFDVWRTGPGSVALSGVSYTDAQAAVIGTFDHRIICLDSDSPGRYRASQLYEQLSALPGETTHVTLESAKDACGASREEILQLRDFLK